MTKRYFSSGLVATITHKKSNLGPGLGVHNDYYNVSFSVNGSVLTGRNLLRLPYGFPHWVDTAEAFDQSLIEALEECCYISETQEYIREEGADLLRRKQQIRKLVEDSCSFDPHTLTRQLQFTRTKGAKRTMVLDFSLI